MKRWMILFCLIGVFAGCKREKKQRSAIEDYAKTHNLNGQFTSSGLYYVIETEGTGGHPPSTSTVTVEYKGTLLDGTQFDATPFGKPAEFSLDQVIQGWQEGIPKFQKGGRGKLIIPSALGYGKQAQTKIPANSVLVFDIYLIDWF